MKIFIGAASSENIPNKYMEDCSKMLDLVLKDNDLVFGAYDKGLMGVSYRTAKKYNRHITGICPLVYKESLDAIECDIEEFTTSIIDSTMKIYKNSDAMILLPGGFGCLYEFFTANYCKVCKELDIPIILYNSCGYYDKLISFLNDICNDNFVREKERDNFLVANTPEEVLEILHNMKGD